jgi:hypothetical protein
MRRGRYEGRFFRSAHQACACYILKELDYWIALEEREVNSEGR